MTFLVAHAELDKGHSKAAIKAIEEHVNTDGDKEAVIYFGKATCRMYYLSGQKLCGRRKTTSHSRRGACLGQQD